jgi:2-hydroxy-3-keto-5-methylthiopentenyl-1-phosphate phosphatase
MKTRNHSYGALISSDWNECLAPCGPFDFITFTYPSLEQETKEIFKAYTGNLISLSEATQRMSSLLAHTIAEEQMDTYLDERFVTYRGVPDLIEWCGKNNILFMINTTGAQGYFQRVFKKGLLPHVPVISANPMIKFVEKGGTSCQYHDLIEIQDKPANTQKIMGEFGIEGSKTFLIGDSGGDGPHFEWGAKIGAFLTGSMTKSSLDQYCSRKGIKINLYFGPRYSKGEDRTDGLEMRVDFIDLIPEIEKIL